jgi:hypothetical protein
VISQSEFAEQEGGKSQCELILARLALTPGQWVPMPELAEHSGAYAVHSRISDLRKNGHNIEHKNEWDGNAPANLSTACSPSSKPPPRSHCCET